MPLSLSARTVTSRRLVDESCGVMEMLNCTFALPASPSLISGASAGAVAGLTSRTAGRILTLVRALAPRGNLAVVRCPGRAAVTMNSKLAVCDVPPAVQSCVAVSLTEMVPSLFVSVKRMETPCALSLNAIRPPVPTSTSLESVPVKVTVSPSETLVGEGVAVRVAVSLSLIVTVATFAEPMR